MRWLVGKPPTKMIFRPRDLKSDPFLGSHIWQPHAKPPGTQIWGFTGPGINPKRLPQHLLIERRGEDLRAGTSAGALMR